MFLPRNSDKKNSLMKRCALEPLTPERQIPCQINHRFHENRFESARLRKQNANTQTDARSLGMDKCASLEANYKQERGRVHTKAA